MTEMQRRLDALHSNQYLAGQVESEVTRQIDNVHAPRVSAMEGRSRAELPAQAGDAGVATQKPGWGKGTCA